jgi:NAD-dependent dihydropyrimidine dehydrogenase PreA subunit
MDYGIIVGTQSRSKGIKVYRLMGFFPGLFEYTLMRGETGEKEKRLIKLFDKLFNEMSEITQSNYDNLVPQFKNFPPIDRIVPVEQEIKDIKGETVLPFEEVTKIFDLYDDIAVVHCYCRHEKDLLGEPCKVTDERENCFLFGKSAQFVIEHNFGRPINKEEAKKLIISAEDDGLVHKAFHIHSDVEREEEALCNCCKCCCGIFQLYYKGIMPYHCHTSYLAQINDEACVGCGTCVNKCPMETIHLENAIAVLNKDKCIGCGVCVHHCPEQAISLKRTGLREVFVPPPKKAQVNP